MMVTSKELFLHVLLFAPLTFGFVDRSNMCTTKSFQISAKTFDLYAVSDPDINKEGRKLTPAQKAIQNSVRRDNSEFDKLKKVAYIAVDSIQSISNKKQSLPQKTLVVDGYSDLQRRSTPTEKLVKVLNEPSPNNPRPSLSVFDTVKEVVYDTADAAASIGKVASNSKLIASEPVKEIIPSKRSISQEMLDAIPDLKSSNPILRLAAEAKLKNLEFQQEALAKQREFQAKVDSVKQTIYSTGDAFNESVEKVKAIPSQVTKLVQETQEFLAAIPVSVQKTVDEVAAIPSKVEQKVSEVQQSVDNTVAKAKQTIDDVKAIPRRVQETVDNTKKSIDNTIKTAEEVQTNAKVLLGLEKPKPKPPKTPPPKPPSGSEVAFKILGSVASATGKAFLWVGKSAADLSLKAAKAGAEAIKESASKQFEANSSTFQLPKLDLQLSAKEKVKVPVVKQTKDQLIEVVQATSSLTSSSKSGKSLDVMETAALEQEVADALKLAEDALITTSTFDNKSKLNSTNQALDEQGPMKSDGKSS